MDNQHHFILTLFQQFIAGDAALTQKLLENTQFQVEHRSWHFKLPDLFAFCQHQNPGYAELSYKQFRHMLFNSPINQLLKEQAAEIVISNNAFNVDQSTYALNFVKLPTHR